MLRLSFSGISAGKYKRVWDLVTPVETLSPVSKELVDHSQSERPPQAPLVRYTVSLAKRVAKVMRSRGGIEKGLTSPSTGVISPSTGISNDSNCKTDLYVVAGMRYGSPSVNDGLRRLRDLGYGRRIVVLPLFPHQSGVTTGSVYDEVMREFMSWRQVPHLRMISDYTQCEAYPRAVAESIRIFWSTRGFGDKLLLSFHGLPASNIRKGDPYYFQCHQTFQEVRQHLLTGDTSKCDVARFFRDEDKKQADKAKEEKQLKSDLTKDQKGCDPSQVIPWSHKFLQMVFQSRFGPTKWLEPNITDVLRELANGGAKVVDVVCPGFAVDCLETLDEIGIEYNELFNELCHEAVLKGVRSKDAANGRLRYIPCLNDTNLGTEMMADVLVDNLNEKWA
eukprot:GHVN01035463.1.p1 GENE.GHVN01035463.1~~GHVN01035463.1.p1  ORF type:complete len:392 (-),score=32.04 GHVN01035463.1:563-1738(-)